MNPELQSVFQQPFEEQIAFFKGKLVLSTEHWDDILKSAHDRAFIVAGAQKAELLADFYQAVQTSIAEGKSLGWFRKEFDAIVARHGWEYNGERNWRSRVIYQTNMATSYAAGRQAQLNDPDLVKVRPYVRYVHSDSVLHPRPLHVSWDGLVLHRDDPWLQTHTPPNGWGCRCRLVAARQSEYDQAAKKVAPDDGTWTKIDRWGEAHTIPNGIDYGWDYAPGEGMKAPLEKMLKEKMATLPESIGADLAAEMKKQGIDAMPARKVFEAQATTAKAEKWAVANNLADMADYSGVKVEVANEWNRSLFEHLEEFPALRSRCKFVGTAQAQNARHREIEIQRYIDALRAINPHLPADFNFRRRAEKVVKPIRVDSRTWAHAWDHPDVAGIAVNKRWASDVEAFKASIVASVETKWHPPGCNTIRSVADHEMGHMLDYLLGLHVDSGIVSAYEEAKLLGIKEEVSGYADKNIREFIAECWAESINNPAPRDFAKRVSAIVRARYADKYA